MNTLGGISEKVLQAFVGSNEPTDAELFEACRAGDEAAWEKFVERFQRLVATVPRRAGLGEEAVAEIFQETFVALVEKMDEIRQPERVRSWLVTTAKYKTWHVIAREKGIRIISVDDEDAAFPQEIRDIAPLPDKVLEELDQQHRLRKAVALLDDRCRVILTMLYLSEPSATYAEVACTVGASETSISPFRARCLKKLLKFFSH